MTLLNPSAQSTRFRDIRHSPDIAAFEGVPELQTQVRDPARANSTFKRRNRVSVNDIWQDMVGGTASIQRWCIEKDWEKRSEKGEGRT